MKIPISKDELAKLLAEHGASAFADGRRGLATPSEETQAAGVAVTRAFAEQWDLIGNLVAAAREDRSHDALRKALRSYMSELSEEYWCAGWLHDVEVLLWQDVTGEVTFLTSEQSEKLRTLSTLCGGWHTYDEFVPLDEWERRFAQRTPRLTV